ncbi:MAG: chemotaxis protein CheA [Candidatus Omnitrophica bacterium]|nr:chemotaxis protein CheA [Candidatus Omnitrophota bacterium]
MQDSYKELFLSESQEYLGNISKCLVKIEENPADSPSINEIFRGIHTLKGMSATMGYDKLTALCHLAEDLLDEVRNKKRKLNSEIIDILFAAVDIIGELLEEIKVNKPSVVDIGEVTQRLKKFLLIKDKEVDEGLTAAAKSVLASGDKFAFSESETKTVRQAQDKGFQVFKIVITLNHDCVMKEARAFLVITNLRKLGEILKSVPEVENLKEGKFEFFFTVFLASKEDQRIIRQELLSISEIEEVVVSSAEVQEKTAAEVKSTVQTASAQAGPVYVKKIQSMRIPVERLDKIMNLMGELAIAKIRLAQTVQTYKIEPLEEVVFMLDRLITTLQDEVMQTRLLPVAYILDAFPRVVRDVARKQNKEVDLEILGSEIELDRVVLDEISDPLLHLVRNSIDHGLETPEDRIKKKKSPRGKVTIQVSRQKGQIFIEVGDDGRGVDFQAVKKVALAKGLITEEETKDLDEKRILDLIALPGFTTSAKITDISGRGVGLDVVKSKIEALGGRVDFETTKDVGSKFILTLPLTLAIIKAMLVKVQEEIYAVPLMNIRETIKISKKELKYLQNFEVIKVRDEVIPIIRLDKILGVASSKLKPEDGDGRLSLVIVEYGKKAMGLVVSQVLGEQDIAVKPLGALVKRTKGIAGATILGDGRVALILDIMSLM